jgi:SAM-dependent methyltransferase
MWKRFVKAAVRQGLRPKRVRWLIQAELDSQRAVSRVAQPNPDLVGLAFVDRSGRRHPLDPYLRDRLKPQWRMMCDPVAIARPPTDEALAGRARNAEKSVRDARALVASLADRQLAGRLLEVGCYDGSIAFQFAREPETTVVASDLARYYLVQEPGASVSDDLGRQQGVLARLRERARRASGAAQGPAEGSVEFVEDDITATNLEPGTFDAILSFEVVEHLADPPAAFASIARLLKPGGVVYMEYNPFFSANGGHSLCTLDLPWGHARLQPDDFERYLREIRPLEFDQALRFYEQSLNRLTLDGLRAAVSGADLELLAVLPWTDRTLVQRVDPDVLADVQAIYPTATELDLLATFVTVVARRAAVS